MTSENNILLENDEVYLDELKIKSIDDHGNATCIWVDENGNEYSAVFKTKSLTKQPEFQPGGFLG